MFHLAEMLGKTIAEIEGMPAAEMLEWAAYLNLKAKGTKPIMSPEQLLTAAKGITATSRGPKGRGR